MKRLMQKPFRCSTILNSDAQESPADFATNYTKNTEGNPDWGRPRVPWATDRDRRWDCAGVERDVGSAG